VDMAMSHSPEPVIWIVRSDGALLSLTFNPENGTVAWARHDSDGDAFEAVTTVPNGSYEVPFFVVRRTVNGATKRYVEYLPQRSVTNVFLDCAVAKTQASSSTITGLGHLEGRTVGVLADGTYRGTCVVAGGQVTFTGGAATNVVAGLPIVADWEPLDFPQARDRVKVVATVGVEYRQNPPVADPAAGLRIGPDAAGAQASDIRKFSDARDGVLRVAVDRSYGPGARVFLRHTQPFPLEIRGVTREVRA